MNEMGPCRNCVGRDTTHRILGLFTNMFSCGKVFFINKALQRTKPGNLVVPYAAVADGIGCHLLTHVAITKVNCVLHRS